MLNNCTIQGRMTRDPELRYTASNTPAVSFTLAVDRSRKNSNGEYDTDFIDCACFGKTAEFVKQWFQKGSMAIVIGRIQSRNWEDKNGNKRTSISVNVSEIMFGESKKDKDAKDKPTPNPEPAAPHFDLSVGDTDFEELDDLPDVPF